MMRAMGYFLNGDGKGNFKAVPAKDSGLKMDGEVRDIVTLKTSKGELILASRNNDSILAFKKIDKVIQRSYFAGSYCWLFVIGLIACQDNQKK